MHRAVPRRTSSAHPSPEATVPGWDNKPAARPSAYMAMWKYKGVPVLCIDGQRMLGTPLTATQQAFLLALEVPADCFTQHPKDG